MGSHRFAMLGALCVAAAQGATVSSWGLANDERFEVYSQAGVESARAALAQFEQLRAWLLQQTGLKAVRARPVRVICFASAEEYLPYRLRANSDAYYIGTEGRDYIVMSMDGGNQPGVAAHELAHLVLHAGGFSLPPWLAEGLAELFATVRFSSAGATLGGDRPAHSQLLGRRPWIPLGQLLAWEREDRPEENREQVALFYAQSWALADMLALSPEYGPRLRAAVLSMASGAASERSLAAVYGKPVQAIEADLRTWVGRRRFAPVVRLAGAAAGDSPAAVSSVTEPRARMLIAGMLLDAGETDRAEVLYRDLLREAPWEGDAWAGLGMIALRGGDRASAAEDWKRAIEFGAGDDALCYRYAVLADEAGYPSENIRPVLERAIELRPDFDDARFQLAILEKNAGRMEAALAQFLAMRQVQPARAFFYWSAVSDALNDLGRGGEAEAAAHKAGAIAATPAERARAEQLEYMARTKIVLRFSPAADGTPRMAAVRAPADAKDWNPFVEPDDDVRRIQGALRRIECGETAIRIVLDAAGGPLALAILNPARVDMRNGPSEFTCGPQRGEIVTVVYAASKIENPQAEGVVRGMEFQ